jgi:uncharacterized RDD family membrane protein YckC
MLDEQLYSVETPEQIDLRYDLAGIGSRFLAALIDHTLIAIILSLACVGATLLADQLSLGLDSFIILSIFAVGVYLFLCAYYIFFETTWNGQTPGKRLIGIRMVRTGGRPIGFLGSAIRNFIRLADFLPILYGIGVVVMFIDGRSRRLGDLAAGALAVKEGKQVTLAMLDTSVAVDTPAVPAASEVSIPNLDSITPEDVRLVDTFLRRRLSLGLEARQRLAELLVTGLERRLGYQIQGDRETFLLQLAAEYQLLRQGPQSISVEDRASAI